MFLFGGESNTGAPDTGTGAVLACACGASVTAMCKQKPCACSGLLNDLWTLRAAGGDVEDSAAAWVPLDLPGTAPAPRKAAAVAGALACMRHCLSCKRVESMLHPCMIPGSAWVA